MNNHVSPVDNLAETISSLNRSLCTQRQLIEQLSSHLNAAFLPYVADAPRADLPWRARADAPRADVPWKQRPDNECPVCGEPTTANGDCQHSPDCEYGEFALDMRLKLLEYRQNGFDARLNVEIPADIAEGMTGVTADAYSRIDAVSERLAIWEQWAAKQEKRIDDTLEYVAERTEGATTQCNESAAALVTVAVAAMDKRADVICKRADLMFEAMQMMTARIEALEQQNALLNRQAH